MNDHINGCIVLARNSGQNELAKQAAAELKAKDEALAAAQNTVTAYAAAARAIALWTDKYCNKDLPYDEMIAQAVRDMAKDSEAKDETLAAARELLEDTYLLCSMDGHEDDGGRNLCNGCDHVWGEGHSDGCRVGKLEAALSKAAP